MGDPKFSRKKFKRPSHPWQKARIVEEEHLKKKYAYKNKCELWKVTSKLRNIRAQARSLIPRIGTKQGDLEKKQLIDKLLRYGLISDKADLDDILKLSIEDLLNRRLQSLIFKKGLANTVKQARQLIVHGHVCVGDRAVTSPSYFVTVKEEALIGVKPELLEILKKRQVAEIKKEVENVKESIEEGRSNRGEE